MNGGKRTLSTNRKTPADRSGIRNISDKHQEEDTLRESEARYRQLVETTTDWIWETDLEGNHTYSNPAGETFLGYTVSEIIGTSAFSHIPPDDEHRLRELISRGIDEKDARPYTTTIQWIHKDGSVHFFESAITPLVNSQGEITGFRGIDRDITGRKQAEKALLLANRKLSMLNSITRHDINNQLLSLLGYLEISKESLGNPARIAEFIAMEEKIAETIARQIDFTKDYEDLGVNVPEWQNLNTVIRSVISHLPMQNIRVDAGFPNLDVFADPLLEKVFYNLIDNALRYGGEKMTAIHVTTRNEQGMLIITVEDDGTGIFAENKTHLFMKGFGKHTGLGLYLSREILSITGITINENGEAGKGARFEMVVPEGRYRFTDLMEK
jgi:PAS domain S-box-containing protein